MGFFSGLGAALGVGGAQIHIEIPTDDPDCYRLYPRHRWIYNKLFVAESQGLACGPHGLEPTTYPVFSKPTHMTIPERK